MNNNSQTFFFYGTNDTFLWVGGVPQGSSLSSATGWLYVVVKNSSGIFSNGLGTFVKTELAQTWFVLSASFSPTSTTLTLFNWNSANTLDAPLGPYTMDVVFNQNVTSSGRCAYFGWAPSYVQSAIMTQIGSSSFSYWVGRVDEIRIFSNIRTFTEAQEQCYQRLAGNQVRSAVTQ